MFWQSVTSSFRLLDAIQFPNYYFWASEKKKGVVGGRDGLYFCVLNVVPDQRFGGLLH